MLDSQRSLRFFLGGYDLEMVVIRDILEAQGADFVDHQLTWGASASAYATEVRNAVKLGVTPVLVELLNDLETVLHNHVIEVDHHGSRAGVKAPTSLEQVLTLLKLPALQSQSNRWWQLVAANDRGHIRAMRALTPPASDDEVRSVRIAEHCSLILKPACPSRIERAATEVLFSLAMTIDFAAGSAISGC